MGSEVGGLSPTPRHMGTPVARVASLNQPAVLQMGLPTKKLWVDTSLTTAVQPAKLDHSTSRGQKRARSAASPHDQSAWQSSSKASRGAVPSFVPVRAAPRPIQTAQPVTVPVSSESTIV